MIVGTISGIAPTWLTHSRPGYRPRTRLNTSSVPRIVARTVVHVAILRLRNVAASQTGSFTYAAYQPSDHPAPRHAPAGPELPRASGRLPWATLLRRVFAIEVLVCPRCAGPRRILDTVTEPEAVRRLLGALGLAAQPPPGRPVTAS